MPPSCLTKMVVLSKLVVLVSTVLLLSIRACRAGSCYSCKYVLQKGTLGNYVDCVGANNMNNVGTMSCDNFCVTSRLLNFNSDLVWSFNRSCSATDLGNSCVQLNSTINMCYSSCLGDNCNKYSGNPFLDRNTPTGPYVQCNLCSYTQSGGGDIRCVNSPGAVATTITCPGNAFCVTTSTLTSSKTAVSFTRTCSTTNPGISCTPTQGGQYQCSTSCSTPFCNTIRAQDIDINNRGNKASAAQSQQRTTQKSTSKTTTTTRKPTTATTKSTTTKKPITTTTKPTTTTKKPTATTTKPTKKKKVPTATLR